MGDKEESRRRAREKNIARAWVYSFFLSAIGYVWIGYSLWSIGISASLGLAIALTFLIIIIAHFIKVLCELSNL